MRRGTSCAASVTDTVEESIDDPVARLAPELRDVVGDLQRVPRRRALVEHRGGEVGEPGMSAGFASLPVLTTRLADTTGRPVRRA